MGNPGSARTAVIAAAGHGSRLLPLTASTPKCLLPIAGEPILGRLVRMAREDLGVEEVVVLVGGLGEAVRGWLGDGERFGVRVRYLHNPSPEKGLGDGIARVEGEVPTPFVLLLGDEVYHGSNHAELPALAASRDADAVVGVRREPDPRVIARTCSATLQGGALVGLEERPERVDGPWMGTGTYLIGPAVFDSLRRTPPSRRTGRRELTDALDRLARDGGTVLPFELRGEYVNVNRIEDLRAARSVVRTASFPTCRRSLVIPAYEEEDSVAFVVREFRPWVDEVLVVDGGSRDATAREAEAAGARVLTLSPGGYGAAIAHGLDHASGEVLIVAEADGTFRARDLGRLLETLKDADMVVGTRTAPPWIEHNARMDPPQRWANVAVAGLLGALWRSEGSGTRLTDVGCTYRALWRDVWEEVRGHVRGVGPEFSPEMMIEVLRARRRLAEVPVHYAPRIGGRSKHSAGYAPLAHTALRMLRTIGERRFRG